MSYERYVANQVETLAVTLANMNMPQAEIHVRKLHRKLMAMLPGAGSGPSLDTVLRKRYAMYAYYSQHGKLFMVHTRRSEKHKWQAVELLPREDMAVLFTTQLEDDPALRHECLRETADWDFKANALKETKKKGERVEPFMFE